MTTAHMTLPVSTISLAGAETAIAAARNAATDHGVAVTITVLDRGGHLVSLARMDGVHVGTVAVATAKAKTAVYYNRPTAALHAAIAGGNNALLSLPDMVSLPGGIPLGVDSGGPIGAIGVSGGPPEIDEAIAVAGVEGFRRGSNDS